MCGLVGIISKHSKIIDPAMIQSMAASLVHRGPDDEGIFATDWLGLGFRRLSIIDISSNGHQPMFDQEKRYVCVFNGEIYNYRELRAELEMVGVKFRTQSDTEVLLNAYIYWGETCLEKLIGMFAFVIADLKKQCVFVARDFPGIKPIYFTEDKNYYYFSSEIKAFSKAISLSVDPDTYFEQFNFRYLAGTRTPFRNVCKILPGEYWKIDSKKNIEKYNYFNLSKTFQGHGDTRSFNDIVKDTKNILQKSFLLHTRSDVGYCVQLSGGVDSSYLTSVLAKSDKNIHTFSIQSDIDELDESNFQRQVVERYGTHHHAFTMTGKEYADQLERATYYLEAPMMHSGSVFLMALCRHIHETSKVVLTGEGADELFGGYWRHKPSRHEKIVFQLQKFGFSGQWLPSISKLGTLKNLLQENVIENSHCYQNTLDFDYFFSTPKNFYPERSSLANSVNKDYIANILAYDQLTYLSSVLDRQDKLSMSYSVEARVPYCHQDLYRLLNSVPSRYKIYRGERKAILKQCTHDYLPRELVYRRKNGFRLPLNEWYRDIHLVGRYLDLLTDNTAKQRGIYRYNHLLKAVDDFVKGSHRYAKSIIMLVNLELWHRVYNL